MPDEMTDEVRFIHIRRKDKEGRLLARGGVTYGYCLAEGGLLLVSKARCSKRDNYCKAIGRNIASGRLAANKLVATVDRVDIYGSLHEAVMANV